MSSILDSLKKLEKETSQQDHPLVHARTDRKAGIPKYAIGIIGLLCVCVAAIGLAVYYRGAPRKQPASLSKVMVPASKPAVTLDDPKTPPPPRNSLPVPSPSNPANDIATTATATLEAKPVDRESTAKLILTEEQGSIPDANPEAEKASAIEAAPKEEPKEEKALKEPGQQVLTAEEKPSDSLGDLSQKGPPQKKKTLQIDRLEGVGIKIQAISWSETPEESLAVINNRVLREGGSIEGYQVSRINPDDIILQRGGKAFQLDFRSTGAP